jgi:hypothetical protein
MNMHDEAINITIDGYKGVAIAYILAPDNGDLLSSNVQLNGNRLIYDGNRLPSLLNYGQSTSMPIYLPSKRFGFWILNVIAFAG